MIRAHILSSTERFPLGERGKFHVMWELPSDADANAVWSWGIPGVATRGNRVYATWDIAPLLARYLAPLDAELLLLPKVNVQFPGLTRFKALKFNEKWWKHQPTAILRAASQSGFLLADAPRGRKSFSVIAATVLVEAKKIIVFCTKPLKKMWPREVQKWLGPDSDETALILQGRSGDEARWFCVPCLGRGTTSPPEAGAARPKCIACRGRGTILISVKPSRLEVVAGNVGELVDTAKVVPVAPTIDPLDIALAEISGFQPPETAPPPVPSCPLPPKIRAEGPFVHYPWKRFGCARKHPGELPIAALECTSCREELESALRSAKWTVANYDVLVPQRSTKKDGQVFIRRGLRGWGAYLAALGVRYDYGIIDEAHRVSGVDKDADSVDEARARADWCARILAPVPQVTLITATPTRTYLRDLYQLLRLITGGTYGEGKKRFNHDVRYTSAYRGDFGWVNTGKSIWASTELPDRLKVLMLQRSREEILKMQYGADFDAAGRKLRIVNRVEVEDPKQAALLRKWKKGVPSAKGAIMAEVTRINALLRPLVLESILEEMRAGQVIGDDTPRSIKAIVAHFHIKSMKSFADEAEKAMLREPLLKRLGFTVWRCHGELGDARDEMAARFREHQGPAIWSTTIKGAPEGLGLQSEVPEFPTMRVDFVDPDDSPNMMHQCENRGAELDVPPGYTVYNWIAEHSISEHLYEKLLPKIEMLEQVFRDKNATQMREAITGSKVELPPEDWEAVLARHTAHIKEDDE